jgi:putative transposase
MQIQLSFQKSNWRHRYSHGGTLRKQRAGRGARPLSTRDPLHLVFKANKATIKGGFRSSQRFALVHHLVQKYKFKFYVKVEQISIQNDHLHLLIRTSRRSNFQSFFRVVAGQIAQRFEKEGLLNVVTDTPAGLAGNTGTAKGTRTGTGTGARIGTGRILRKLWVHRPFSRVVKGWKAYQVVRDYIQLNEKEALGEISYKPNRLKGLSSSEWQILWR